jgi:16S rRNA (guanine527-N7)-methyltransferase
MDTEAVPTPDFVEHILLKGGLEASPSLIHSVIQYVTLLKKWNRHINLTGIRTTSGILTTLFAESFFASRYLEATDSPVLDIGSGAGFPGMAMKLYSPERVFYLLEPRKKKAAFLATVRRELGLSGIHILNKTLQDCHLSDFAFPPTLLTLRALGDVGRWIRLSLPLLAKSARVMLFLTSDDFEEIEAALPQMNWQTPIPVPQTRERVLLIGQRSM